MFNTSSIRISKYCLLLLAFPAVIIGSTPVNPVGLIPLLDGRIVGGMATTIDQFPHQISLRNMGSHRCGGTIINENTIVTAAHCVIGTSPNNLIIRAGTTYRNSGGVDRRVIRSIAHEQFSMNHMHNDIAILIVSGRFQYSTFIQPAMLPTQNERLRDGTEALVSGWGTLRENGQTPNNLQYVQVNLMSQNECLRSYSRLTSSMFCAGFRNGGRDACQGDSGGPLISKLSRGKAKLIGVVSWGLGCARPGYPGVYTNVATLRSWIEQRLRYL